MSLLGLLAAVILLGLIFYVLWWGVAQLALPAPFDKVARVILVLLVIVALVGLFTGGVPIPTLRL